MNIRIFDNGLEGDKLQDILTAVAGIWGTTELENNGEDIAIGNIIIGFRYDITALVGYPLGDSDWHKTMALISYADGTSEIKTFTSELTLTKQATMVVLITRNLT